MKRASAALVLALVALTAWTEPVARISNTGQNHFTCQCRWGRCYKIDDYYGY